MPVFDRIAKAKRYFLVLATGLAWTSLGWFCCEETLAQMQYSMGGQPVSKEVYEAGQIVNDSVGLLQQNKNQEAVDQLLRAEQMAPGMANLHTNLGLGLAKLGRSQEAIKELETSKSLDPSLAATWLTLGGIYQSQGMVNQAIDTYNEFIRRFPDHRDAAKIVSLVSGLKKEVADGVIHPMSASGAPVDNYLGEMGSRASRWPINKLPIKVYIRPGDGVPGYKPIYATILGQSFNAWQEASQGGLSFQPVSNAGQADLECSFTNDSSTFKNLAEAGETYLFANSQGPVRGTIKLLTIPLVAALPLTDNRMRQICLHEIGHAIGFGAHTSNPQDVMFYSTSVSDSFPHLSPRDANSVRLLYGGSAQNQTPLVNQPASGQRMQRINPQ
jgi:tetratricopeptide (TPR) repeat protein